MLYSNIYPTRCNVTQFIYIWKLLYIIRVVPPPIIRSANNCIYSIWYLSHHYCYLPLQTDMSGILEERLFSGHKLCVRHIVKNKLINVIYDVTVTSTGIIPYQVSQKSVQVKVNFTLEHAMKAQRGSLCIDVLFL
jgi:hypothetical protein